MVMKPDKVRCCRFLFSLACVAADSFPFSGRAEIKQANEKRASEGARLGWAKKKFRSFPTVRERLEKERKRLLRRLASSLFWPWPCTIRNNYLLRTEELANRNVLCWLRNSIVSEHKTKDCALWTFQPKSWHLCWHLCLLLWCLPGFTCTTIPLY